MVVVVLPAILTRDMERWKRWGSQSHGWTVVSGWCRSVRPRYNLWLYHFPLTINKTLQIILVHLPVCIIKWKHQRFAQRWTPVQQMATSEHKIIMGTTSSNCIPHWKTKFHIHANEQKSTRRRPARAIRERTECDFMCAFALRFGLVFKAHIFHPYTKNVNAATRAAEKICIFVGILFFICLYSRFTDLKRANVIQIQPQVQ